MMRADDRYNLKDTSIVVVTGLLLAFVFNVKGVYNWAKRLPHGEVRESFLTVLEPINEAYEFTGIATPKDWLADWFNGNRTIVKPIVIEPLAPDAMPLVGPPVPPNLEEILEKERLLKEGPQKILVMGDSMMVGALGKVLVAELEKTPFEPVRRARISTGLARPDYFNWEKEVVNIYRDQKFVKAFVMLGGNDTQDIKYGGKTIYLGTKAWAKIYAKRVRKIVDYMCKKTPEIVWLGSPPMRSKSYDRKIQFVNKVLYSSLKNYKCAKYFPTAQIFRDKTGRYASYQKVFGKFRKVRMQDGIHLTRSGGQLLAHHLFEKVNLAD